MKKGPVPPEHDRAPVWQAWAVALGFMALLVLSIIVANR